MFKTALYLLVKYIKKQNMEYTNYIKNLKAPFTIEYKSTSTKSYAIDCKDQFSYVNSALSFK